jgi:hypothetical protein
VGAVLVGVVIVVIAWAVRRRRFGPGGHPPVPSFYARALRRLARRGLRPAPHETAREFCTRVGLEAPALTTPLARLTTAYEATRFGAQPVSAAESRALLELATRL